MTAFEESVQLSTIAELKVCLIFQRSLLFFFHCDLCSTVVIQKIQDDQK